MKNRRILILFALYSLLLPFGLRAADADFPTYKTFGTVGKQQSSLRADKEAELFSYTGKGCLTHMWFGGAWKGCEKTRLRIYVDGEPNASIDMELFLGHGIGFGDGFSPWGIAHFGKTGSGTTVYNTYRIPFGKSVRVTAQLGEGVTGHPPFWWIIRGTENLPLEVGGVTLPNTARLKLIRLEDHLAKPFEEFALCDVPGSGALYQVTMAAHSDRETGSWTDLSYMEGCMRAYLNGSKEPLMLSSGLEDYFLGTYYFDRGRYANDIAGLTHFDKARHEFSAYRFHDQDPVFFQSGLRLTARCGEYVDDKPVGNPPPTHYTTYVWLYQW